jgi:hypothetical protein
MGDVEERCSQISKRGMESTCTEQRRKALSSGLLGAFAPTCEDDGSYKRFQCHERYCFCVDPASGEKMPGSSMSMDEFSSFDEAEQSCSVGSFQDQTLVQLTECQTKRKAALSSGLIGAFVPRCEDDGSYHHTQCHGSMCFCAHPETGESRGAGGSIADLEEVERKCQTYTKRGAVSKCLAQREKVLSSGLIGAHPPLCEEDGSYSRMQCREAMCYCADPESGEAIEGSTGHVSEYEEMKEHCNSLATFHSFAAEDVPKKDCKNKRIAYRWNKCPKECKYHQGYGEALVICCCD